MSTGAKLKELRGIKTQQEVADEIGITKSALAMYERDERIPRDEVKIRIAEYFGVSSDYLLGVESLKEKTMTILDDPDLTLTADEKWFILKLRQLDKEGRTVVEGTLVSEVRRVENEKGKTASAG